MLMMRAASGAEGQRAARLMLMMRAGSGQRAKASAAGALVRG